MYANSKFDAYLTAFCKARGITYADFSAQCGVGITGITSMRKGGGCNFYTAHLVADALGITLEELYKLVY